ncbi:hypothetical protein F5X97DRAFT_121910 [Nemania serpens]|nr:hypothetical protein F5X97DRAFT_121910 [Nemania serpens]
MHQDVRYEGGWHVQPVIKKPEKLRGEYDPRLDPVLQGDSVSSFLNAQRHRAASPRHGTHLPATPCQSFLTLRYPSSILPKTCSPASRMPDMTRKTSAGHQTSRGSLWKGPERGSGNAWMRYGTPRRQKPRPAMSLRCGAREWVGRAATRTR